VEASGRAQLERAAPVALFVAIWAGLVWTYQPSRYYFFNDAWDMLYGLLADPRSILRPHNEYFLPLFKGLFFIEYATLGRSHLWYMLIALAVHSTNAVLVYLLARSFALRWWAALGAAGMFAFSAVPWEITATSFGQCVTLPTFCMLAAVLTFRTRPIRGATLAAVAALSLAAFWVGGPPPVWLPLLLTLIYLQSGGLGALRPPSVRPALVFAAIWAPLAIYLASLRAVMTFDAVLSSHQTRISLASVPGMAEYTWVGAIFGLLSPSVTGRQGYSDSTNLVNAALVGLFLAFAYWRLPSRTARRDFCFLAAFILLPYPVISLGRLQLGLSLAASSRYQYVPLAGFVLLVMLCWQATQASWRAPRARQGFAAVGLLLLAYHLVSHAAIIREGTPAATWGVAAQQFVHDAEAATYPATNSAGTRILGPELPVPDSLHRSSAFPLWRVLQILAGTTETIMPAGDYLRDKDASVAGNLARNGGFEDAPGTEWTVDPDGVLERSSVARRMGGFGAVARLARAGSAVRQQVVRMCPETLPGKIVSFSIQVRSADAGAVSSHVVFKDVSGGVLERPSSPDHPVVRDWSPVLVTAWSPPGTCAVEVEVASTVSHPVSLELDDAIVILHPAVAAESPR
jgi:hypothetical protein